MNTKAVGLIVLVLVLAGGAYFLLPQTSPDAGQGAPLQKRKAPEISWNFTDNGYDEAKYADTTKVTLTVDGVSHDVGVYLGTCNELSGTERTDGALSAVLCWFAGGGDEIGVFVEEAEQLVVKKREVQEPTAETPEFKGEFSTLLAL